MIGVVFLDIFRMREITRSEISRSGWMDRWMNGWGGGF